MRKVLRIFAAALILTLGAQESTIYTWVATGSLQTPRQSACAVSLKNGNVLVIGGTGPDGALDSTEVYGSDGQFAPGAPMSEARSGHTCTLLNDGRVLVTGGRRDGVAISSSEIYDPVNRDWTAVNESGTARWGHTATLVSDGRVLLAAGDTELGPIDLLEVFDPATDSIEALPFTLIAARSQHFAAPLSEGRVLVAGGFNGTIYLETAEVVNLPLALTQRAAPMPEARGRASAETLLNGQVLVTGGRNSAELGTSLLYLADEDHWLLGPPLQTARAEHATLRIPNNGNVLVIGGSAKGQPLASTELFDAVNMAFTEVGSLTAARTNIAAAAQGDGGQILAIGGLGNDGPTAACGVTKAPVLSSDRAVYVEGIPQVLTGSGFRPGETVIFSVVRLSIFDPPTSFSAPGAQASSVTGGVTTTIPPQNPGTTLTISARGVASGLTASVSYKVRTSTSLTLSVNPTQPFAGDEVTIVARVGPTTRLNRIDGFVNFRFGTTDLGTIQLGQNTANAFSFSASDIAFFNLTTTGLKAETNSINASFSGSEFYGSSTAGLRLTIPKRTPDLTFTSLTSPIRLGNPWVVRTKLSGATVTPTGGPKLLDGSTPVDTTGISLSFTPGSKTDDFTVSLSGATGSRMFRLNYAGDDLYTSANVPVSVSVLKSLPEMSLFSSPLTQFDLGQQAVFTGDLSFFLVGPNHPSGTLTWSLDDVNVATTNVGIAPVTTGGHDGHLMQIPEQILMRKCGSSLMRVTYSGDTNYEQASFGPVSVNVRKLNPTMTVTAVQHNTGGAFSTSLTIVLTPPALSLPTGVTAPIPTGFVTVGGFTFNLQTMPGGRSAVATGEIGSVAQNAVNYPGDANFNSAQKFF